MEHHPILPISAFNAFHECNCFRSGGSRDKTAQSGTEIHAQLQSAVDENENDDTDLEWSLESLDLILQKVLGRTRTEIKVLTEERIHIFDEEMNEITFGTADNVVENLIVDWKSGWKERNYLYSMMGYGRGLMQRTGHEKVHAYIVYTSMKKIKNYEFTYEEAIEETDRIINRVLYGEKTETPCEWCDVCGRAAECGALNSTVKRIAQYNAPAMSGWDPAKITSAREMGIMLDVANNLIKPWIKSVEFYSDEMRSKGIIPVGYEEAVKKGTPSIPNLTKLFQSTSLLPEDFLSCCKVTQEKLREKMKLGKKEFDNFISVFVERKPDVRYLKKAGTRS